jgi:2-dehydro-3-deoxyphosphooctonate aldolase (KDO 8-P synthase)
MNEILKLLPGIRYSDENKILLIAGPCVVEDERTVFETADRIFALAEKYRIPFVFKASYRKANRSRSDSFTGIGDTAALRILAGVAERYSIPVVTDIHSPEEAYIASEYVDMLQIPAFLCRQTDLLTAAGKTGKFVNIKKGQFLSGTSMRFAVDKVRETGNDKILLTDRGNMYGYQDLVVDFRNIYEMQKTGLPVIMDITHSLQQPNQESGVSGGKPELIELIGKAAIAVGADGIFVETHPDPGSAKSDGANMLHIEKLEGLIVKLLKIRNTINSF